LDDEILTLDVSELPQSLEECLPHSSAGVGWRGAPEKAYSIDLRSQLRLGGWRYGEQAEGTHQPCAPIHYPITSSACTTRLRSSTPSIARRVIRSSDRHATPGFAAP